MAAASFGKYYLHNHFSLNNNVPILILGFPGGAVVKNLSASEGDTGWIPGLGRSPGDGNGKPLQHSCLGNPMDRREEPVYP